MNTMFGVKKHGKLVFRSNQRQEVWLGLRKQGCLLFAFGPLYVPAFNDGQARITGAQVMIVFLLQRHVL